MRWRRQRPLGHDLTCQQAVALVTAYLDGDLAADASRLFEEHLGECEFCAEHVKQIRATIAIAGQVHDEDLDPLAREDLIALYRRWLATTT